MKLKFISILFLIPTTLSFTLNPAIPVHPPNNDLTQEGLSDNIITHSLEKRWTCPATCPTNICCQNGLCVSSLSDVCCGSYYCDPGWTCCGTGCIPEGTKCCGAPAYYCPASETCWTVNGNVACCQGEGCLGGGGGGSQETYATEAATTKAQTTYVTDVVDYNWYSWTITWSYWVTFYTYYPPETTNILTSTITITNTIVSVTATNSAQASSSFEQLSATMTFPVPASATNPPEPTQSLPTTTASASPTGGITFATFAASSGTNRVLELGWKGMLTTAVIFGTGLLMVYL